MPGAAPCERFQDALLQLHSYVQTDAGRSEEGRLGTRSDERVYPPERPLIVSAKTMAQFLADGCPQADPANMESVWGCLNPFLTASLEQILPGDVLVHEVS